MATPNVDVITIRIHLNELKTKFDNAMREGEEFAALKKIYMEIKQLECYLQVMEWGGDKAKGYSKYIKNHDFIKGKIHYCNYPMEYLFSPKVRRYNISLIYSIIGSYASALILN